MEVSCANKRLLYLRHPSPIINSYTNSSQGDGHLLAHFSLMAWLFIKDLNEYSQFPLLDIAGPAGAPDLGLFLLTRVVG